ncbi:MAG: hypothetical protein IIY21_11715 [Clostridiales bacterium]|nr:hypothetical protein [Clostridiales bacterium]
MDEQEGEEMGTVEPTPLETRIYCLHKLLLEKRKQRTLAGKLLTRLMMYVQSGAYQGTHRMATDTILLDFGTAYKVEELTMDEYYEKTKDYWEEEYKCIFENKSINTVMLSKISKE